VVIKAVCRFLANADRGIRDRVASIRTKSCFPDWLLPYCFQPLRGRTMAVTFLPGVALKIVRAPSVTGRSGLGEISRLYFHLTIALFERTQYKIEIGRRAPCRAS